MGALLRAFIAIEVPEKIRQGLGRIQQKLQVSGLKVRWTHAQGMHLTLKFLGDIRREVVPEAARIMREASAGVGRLELTVGGLGSFPKNGPPRIVWVGVSGDIEPLAALAERLEEDARQLGAKGEDRRYVPHLTLGRIQDVPDDFARTLAEMGDPVLGTFQAEGLTLFMSELTPEGSIYTVLDHVAFE